MVVRELLGCTGRDSPTDSVTAVSHQRSSSRAQLAGGGGSHHTFASKNACGDTSFFPEEASPCPPLLTLHRKATCFINTKESASPKRDSVTTCHFISAGTCQRVTQEAATCHPLTEHIEPPFVKHVNSNQEKISFMNHDATSVNENEVKSHFLQLETTEEEATLQKVSS